MYNKVATDMNFVSREKAIAELWKDRDIIRKSYHHRDGSERFTFFDGPPTANGKPHIGAWHILSPPAGVSLSVTGCSHLAKALPDPHSAPRPGGGKGLL